MSFARDREIQIVRQVGAAETAGCVIEINELHTGSLILLHASVVLSLALPVGSFKSKPGWESTGLLIAEAFPDILFDMC